MIKIKSNKRKEKKREILPNSLLPLLDIGDHFGESEDNSIFEQFNGLSPLCQWRLCTLL